MKKRRIFPSGICKNMCLALLVILLLAATQRGWVQTGSYTFFKIADTGTAIPSGTGNFGNYAGSFFDAFSVAPSIAGTNVAFFGRNSFGRGIYRYNGNALSNTTTTGFLTNVADRNTPVPGGGTSSNFVFFGNAPAISGSNVVFFGGTNSLDEGIFLSSDGLLSSVANKRIRIPGLRDFIVGISNFVITNTNFVILTTNFLAETNFNNLTCFDVSGASVALLGDNSFWGGCYLFSGGILTNVADVLTTVPGKTNNFATLGCPSISSTNVVFFGGTNNAVGGIHLFSGTPGSGALTNLADENTAIPSGTGNFTGFGATPVVSGTNVVFTGTNASGGGVYLVTLPLTGSSLSKVADRNTLIPSGTGSFTGFGQPVLSGANVAFFGTNATGKGIYLFSSGTLSRVADLATAIPGGTGSFTGFGATPSLSGANVVFFGTNSLGGGIYIYSNGALSKVIDQATLLDGKTLNSLTSAFPGLVLGSEALDTEAVVFLANFTDSSSGYFLALTGTLTVPATTIPATVIPATTIPAVGIPGTTTLGTTTSSTTTPATTTPASTSSGITTTGTTTPAVTTPATTTLPTSTPGSSSVK